jgi:hypothetical protein
MESFRTLGNDREASSMLFQSIYAPTFQGCRSTIIRITHASTAVIHNKVEYQPWLIQRVLVGYLGKGDIATIADT